MTNSIDTLKHGDTAYRIISDALGFEPVKNKPFVFSDDSAKGNDYLHSENGYWYVKNFATGQTYSAIDIYMSHHKLDLPTALRQLEKEYLNGNGHTNGHGNSKPAHSVGAKPPDCVPKVAIKAAPPKPFQPPVVRGVKDFTPAEIAYWKQFGITGRVLQAFGVYAVDVYFHYSFDKNRNDWYGYQVTPSEKNGGLVFAYKLSDNCFKIYRPLHPDRKKRFLWLGEKPGTFPDVWGLDMIPENTETIVITEGLKDALAINSHPECFAQKLWATGKENAGEELDARTIADLKSRYTVLLCMDADKAGNEATAKHAQAHSLRCIDLGRFITETLGYETGPELKDMADVFRTAHSQLMEGDTMADLEGVFTELVKAAIDGPEPVNGVAVEMPVEPQVSQSFPVEVLPEQFRALVAGCREALNFPADYTATAILVAASTAVGKSARIRVKAGWHEYPAIYAALVGNAGANKSHPQEMAFRVFSDIDAASIKAYELAFNEYEEARNAAAKSKDAAAKAPEKPRLVKTVLHNFTPEILVQRMGDNGRGCVVAVDELASFLDGMNNYSKGDQTSTYLSFWSNKGTSIDRVSRDVPLFLERPFLNIIGGLQPRVLPRLFPPGKTDSGFLQRFLFAFPDDAEKQPINDRELPDSLREDYAAWVRAVTGERIASDTDTGKPSPVTYAWSREAKAFFYAWQADNTKLVNENSTALKGEVLSKFDIHFVRLALVLHIMDDRANLAVSLKAVEGAAKLCAYYLAGALKVLEAVAGGGPTGALPENKAAFYQALPAEFATAEAKEIGSGMGLNERAVFRLLGDAGLFKKTVYGRYAKT